ncbi:hypothetical protein GIB67_033847 [Kingdonia uniflora]|uniref:GED domain-containing protein n=1 Tax=Kingdonia uniflora TaxID=39325 RepID=A0A7J7LIS5_9MAGN|nr:hypothetical protein GIB67_033847 [Kingdonia uniflora]
MLSNFSWNGKLMYMMEEHVGYRRLDLSMLKLSVVGGHPFSTGGEALFQKKLSIFKHLETVIMSRIPGIQSLINKSIAELVSELSRLGKPIATDVGESYTWSWRLVVFLNKYTSHKEHLDGITNHSDASLLSFWKTIGSAALAYINMICGNLRNSISNSIIYCQVREAKRSLLGHFLAGMGKKEVKQLSSLLNEDPTVMERRFALSKRLELYRSAEAKIDAAGWAK